MTANIIRKFRQSKSITLGVNKLSAKDRCWELAIAFTWFCKGAGLRARLVRVELLRKGIWEGHYVTKLQGRLYCWTARQYDQAANLPAVFANEQEIIDAYSEN